MLLSKLKSEWQIETRFKVGHLIHKSTLLTLVLILLIFYLKQILIEYTYFVLFDFTVFCAEE